ncbi:MAG: GIY-YIG nuclease family protein [Promethearchaeota archaeon]
MAYYVYIVECDNDAFYTGYSRDVDKRMKLHMKGKGARYLRIHKPKRLIYVEECISRAEAMRKERKIKLLSHNQKLRLSKTKLNKIAKNRRKTKKASMI